MATSTFETDIRKEQHEREKEWKQTGRKTREDLKVRRGRHFGRFFAVGWFYVFLFCCCDRLACSVLSSSALGLETGLQRRPLTAVVWFDLVLHMTKGVPDRLFIVSSRIFVFLCCSGMFDILPFDSNHSQDVNMATATIETDIRKEQHTREKQAKETERNTKKANEDINMASAFYG